MSTRVYLDARLNTASVPASGHRQIAYALLEAAAATEVDGAETGPMNLGLVLDTSGSMAGERLRRVREAADVLVGHCEPDTRIAVVGFADEATVLLESTTARELAGSMALDEALEAVKAGGGTHFAPALELGLDQLEPHREAAGASRLVLLTDGREGSRRDAPACRQLADRARSLGIPIVALGVGADWNEDLLLELGQRSGGYADYIARAEDIVTHFTQIIDRIRSAGLREAELTLRLVDGVIPKRVWRTMPQIQNLGATPIEPRFVSVPLGDIDARSGQAILVELEIPARPVGMYRLAQAEVSCLVGVRDPDLAVTRLTPERVRTDILVHYLADARELPPADPIVASVIDRVFAHDLQASGFEAADRGDVAAATRRLNAAATILLEQGEGDLAGMLDDAARSLSQGEQPSPEGRKTIRFETGKTVRLYR